MCQVGLLERLLIGEMGSSYGRGGFFVKSDPVVGRRGVMIVGCQVTAGKYGKHTDKYGKSVVVFLGSGRTLSGHCCAEGIPSPPFLFPFETSHFLVLTGKLPF